MHILTTTAYAGPRGGGISEAVRELCLALVQADCQPTVHALDEPGPKIYLDAWGPISVTQYPSPFGPLGYARGFGKRGSGIRSQETETKGRITDPSSNLSERSRTQSDLRPPAFAPSHFDTFPPQLLHNHGVWVALDSQVTRLAKKLSVPYLVSPHGMLDPWALQNSRWKKRIASTLFEKKHLEGAACLHALNEQEAQAIRDYGLKQPIAIIPNGVEVPDLLSAPPELPGWKRKLPEGSKVMLFLGRIHPKKGLAQFLHSWAAVPKAEERGQRAEVGHQTFEPRPPTPDSRPQSPVRRSSKSEDGSDRPWHLVIAGWDQSNHAAELRTIVRDLDLERSVHFIGPQFGDDKAACFRHADAFVLPSFSEGMPMAVLEAWSYQLPVLMTRACNIDKGFSRGAALEFPIEKNKQPEILAGFLNQSGAELSHMGAVGRSLVEEQFTWESVAHKMISLYLWLIGEDSFPPFIEK